MVQQPELTAEKWLELAERFYTESLKFRRAGATAEEHYKAILLERSAKASERVAVRTRIERERRERAKD